MKASKEGPKMKAFRCSWSGLLYPADYFKEWGRKYGLGLGPVPVSEALNSRTDLPCCIPEGGSMEAAMHPIEVTMAQLDLVEVSEEEYNANRAILASEDPRMEKRARILRGKQLEKPDTKLAALMRQKGHDHG